MIPQQIAEKALLLAQGHPKLIYFLEAKAANPAELAAQLEIMSDLWPGEEKQLRQFFTTNRSSFGEQEFLTSLTLWTEKVSATLPEENKLLFRLVCLLKDEDRQSAVVDGVWTLVWQALEKPAPAPVTDKLLERLQAEALLQTEARTPQDLESGGGQKNYQYYVHPAVAAAGKAEAGEEFTNLCNQSAAKFWAAWYNGALDREETGWGEILVRAATSGTFYSIQSGEWEGALRLLNAIIHRSPAPSTVSIMISLARGIVKATKGMEIELLAQATLGQLLVSEPEYRAEGEALLGDVIRRGKEENKLRIVAASLGGLVEIAIEQADFDRALQLISEEEKYETAAQMTGWEKLMTESRRLRILNHQGRHEEVIAALESGILSGMDQMVSTEVGVEPWRVREVVYDIAHTAYSTIHRHAEAIRANHRAIQSMVERGAPQLKVARTRFNDYGSLAYLGRVDEARELLEWCRNIFENNHDLDMLGRLFSAQSTLEAASGNLEQAIRFAETALRYKYLFPDPDSCGISHSNLANRFFAGQRFEQSLQHRLAAVLLAFQTQSGKLQGRLGFLTLEVANFPTGLPVSVSSYDTLCTALDATEGVEFRKLFDSLPQRMSPDVALQRAIAYARANSQGGTVTK